MSKAVPCSSNRGPTDIEKWEECCKTGLTLMLGGVALGSCASILTMTPFPFLVLSSIGLYSAVENCDNIFRKSETMEVKPTLTEKED